MFNKFIIYDNKLLLGKVNRHKELLPKDFKYELIYGGGQFELNREEKTITLFGKSYDFGRFSTDKLDNLILPFTIEGYTVLERE